MAKKKKQTNDQGEIIKLLKKKEFILFYSIRII